MHIWLDAPDQFPNYVLSTDDWRRLAAVSSKPPYRSRALPPEDECILPKPPRWNQARRLAIT